MSQRKLQIDIGIRACAVAGAAEAMAQAN
jgi:hypothetical protein